MARAILASLLFMPLSPILSYIKSRRGNYRPN